MSRFYAGLVFCTAAVLGSAVSSGTLFADDSSGVAAIVIDQNGSEVETTELDQQLDSRDQGNIDTRRVDRTRDGSIGRDRNRPGNPFGDRNDDEFDDRRNDEGYFCIFEKIDSSYTRRDAFRGFGYSELSACNDAEVQCRRSLYNPGENCRKYSSGWFGWREADVEVLCESKRGRATSCPLGGRALDTGRLYHRHSQSKCDQGRDWNVVPGDSYITVQNGCRGDFIVKTRSYREPDPIPLPPRPF
jgi:hypothetical protein